jgi:predicted nucleic acid-binding protein
LPEQGWHVTTLLDTNILSVFAKLGRLELLFQVLDTPLAVSPNVRRELESGLALGYENLRPALELLETGQLRPISLGATEQGVLARVPFPPDKGEADSLAWCMAHMGTFVTNDERAARRASDLGVPVIRQRDILRALWVKGLLSIEQVRALIVEMETRVGIILPDQDGIFADPSD